MDDSSSRSFEDVVIKLGLITQQQGSTTDSISYRRIACSKLDLKDRDDTTGVISLKKSAVLMHNHRDDNDINHHVIDLNLYRIELTYHDMDNDRIVIVTNDDIIDVLKCSINNGSKVKILAKVSSLGAGIVETVHDRRSVSFAQQQANNEMPIVQLQENPINRDRGASIDILSQLNLLPQENNDSNGTLYSVDSTSFMMNHSPVARKSCYNSGTKISLPPISSRIITGDRFVCGTVDTNDTTTMLVEEQERKKTTETQKKKTISNYEKEEELMIDTPKTDVLTFKSVVDNNIRPFRPFIHGFHTCDGCETKPIIGNRYHSLQNNDFDLCETCMTHYNGNEKFEIVQLGRDCEFQDHWHSRHARNSHTWDRLVCGSVEIDSTAMLVDEQEKHKTTETQEKKTTINEKEQMMIDAPKTDVVDNSIRPFIHGRHTCNGCETTPVVGNRYQSDNNSDFDLCETCMTNYTGNEKFEIVQLECDIKFQDRWHVRHARYGSEQRIRHASYGPLQRRVDNYSLKVLQKCHEQHLPSPLANQGLRLSNSSPLSLFKKKNDEYEELLVVTEDSDLDEAIRRSLEDANKNNQDTMQQNSESKLFDINTISHVDSEGNIVIVDNDEKDDDVVTRDVNITSPVTVNLTSDEHKFSFDAKRPFDSSRLQQQPKMHGTFFPRVHLPNEWFQEKKKDDISKLDRFHSILCEANICQDPSKLVGTTNTPSHGDSADPIILCESFDDKDDDVSNIVKLASPVVTRNLTAVEHSSLDNLFHQDSESKLTVATSTLAHSSDSADSIIVGDTVKDDKDDNGIKSVNTYPRNFSRFDHDANLQDHWHTLRGRFNPGWRFGADQWPQQRPQNSKHAVVPPKTPPQHPPTESISAQQVFGDLIQNTPTSCDSSIDQQENNDLESNTADITVPSHIVDANGRQSKTMHADSTETIIVGDTVNDHKDDDDTKKVKIVSPDTRNLSYSDHDAYLQHRWNTWRERFNAGFRKHQLPPQNHHRVVVPPTTPPQHPPTESSSMQHSEVFGDSVQNTAATSCHGSNDQQDDNDFKSNTIDISVPSRDVDASGRRTKRMKMSIVNDVTSYLK